MDARKLKEVLIYARMGLATEIKNMQENYIRLEKFGDSAVVYTELSNPLRNSDSLSEYSKRISSKVELLRELVEVIDSINSSELERAAQMFKNRN